MTTCNKQLHSYPIHSYPIHSYQIHSHQIYNRPIVMTRQSPKVSRIAASLYSI